MTTIQLHVTGSSQSQGKDRLGTGVKVMFISLLLTPSSLFISGQRLLETLFISVDSVIDLEKKKPAVKPEAWVKFFKPASTSLQGEEG